MGSKRFVVLVLLVSGAAFGLLCSAGRPLAEAEPEKERPASIKGGVPLASGELRDAVAKIDRGEPAGAGVDVVGDAIRVEVIHELSMSKANKLITKHGGVIEGQIDGLVQARVPVDELVALEAERGIRYLRPPLDVSIPIDPPQQVRPPEAGSVAGVITGQEVAKTNADDWHAAGFTGAGVKVGIVDAFDGNLWSAAISAGELPAHSGSYCRVFGIPCTALTFDTGFPGAQHGVGVAEIIHEMAPDAQLYLARVATTTDLQAAVEYFDSQGVAIISRSLTSAYDGPGNGTGPMANVINGAVADGMVWFNSAGNSASDGDPPGQYWRGAWTDTDGDHRIEFAPGVERLPYGCGFANGVRWSDFSSAVPSDYDLFFYDTPSSIMFFESSTNLQTLGAPPLD